MQRFLACGIDPKTKKIRPVYTDEFGGDRDPSWNANTNNPDITSDPQEGDRYFVAKSGTQNLGNGLQTYTAGNTVVFVDGVWEQIAAARAGVASVETPEGGVETGAVSITPEKLGLVGHRSFIFTPSTPNSHLLETFQGRCDRVLVRVLVPFSDPNAAIYVGDLADRDRLMSREHNNPRQVEDYWSNPAHLYDVPTQIWAHCDRSFGDGKAEVIVYF